jgi:exopolysaccharide biosynthesis polyprenyl glycosylphosphotransferase
MRELLGITPDSPQANAKSGELPWQVRYSRWLLLTDSMALVLAVGLAHIIRFGSLPGSTPISGRLPYLELSSAIFACWMLALAINRSRSPRVTGCGAEEYRRIWAGTFGVFGGIAIISMLLKLEVPRAYLIIALPVGLFALTLSRWLARRYVLKARLRDGRYLTRVLALGTASSVRELAESLAREPGHEFRIVGACVTDGVVGTQIRLPEFGVTIPIVGDESNAVSAAIATRTQAITVTSRGSFDASGVRDLSWELEKSDIDLVFAPGVVDVAGPRIQMRPVAGLPLIYLEKPQYHGAKRFEKSLFDVVFAAAALLCALPLLIAIALAIKLTSRGPVLFRQERIGMNGAPFKVFKFRTMVDGADRMAGDLTKLGLATSPRDQFKFVDDPRVTRVGRLLRKYSLDELPQFINVLSREMSVVGPRPQVAEEVKAYDDKTRRRLLVRPGITGLWQISGRSDLSWDDSMRLDLIYVENWSMATDILIALKTAKVVLSHDGAY